jgi:hypothetical protein
MYCEFAFIASGFCARTDITGATQQMVTRITKRVWVALLVVSCVVMFVSFVEFS